MLREAALHTIGQTPVPNFADPLGLMSHCHRKIEGYPAGLAASGEILLAGGGAAELARAFQVMDAAREHFAVRGLKHAAHVLQFISVPLTQERSYCNSLGGA